MSFDVAVIGGSFAGLSAALFLANAQRNVIVIDNGMHRNKSVKHMHNVLGCEKSSPTKLLQKAKRECLATSKCQFVKGLVQKVKKSKKGHFVLLTKDKERLEAKKVIIATGVTDILPNILNAKKFWLKNIFQCPFCSALDFLGKSITVYNPSEGAIFLGLLLSKWASSITICTDEKYIPSKKEKELLSKKKIKLITDKVTHFSGIVGKKITVNFKKHKPTSSKAIFMHLPFKQNAQALLEDLPISLDECNLIPVDQTFQTEIKGVFAVGDCISLMQKVSVASASGFSVGYQIACDFIKEEIEAG